MTNELSLDFLDGIHQSIILLNQNHSILYLNQYFKTSYGKYFDETCALELDSIFEKSNLTVDHGPACTRTLTLKFKPGKAPDGRSINFNIKRFELIPDTFLLVECSCNFCSYEHLHLINAYSNDILAVVGSNFEIEFVSPSVKEVLGYTPEEFKQIDPRLFVHRSDFDVAVSQLMNAIHEQKRDLTLVVRVRKTDGSYAWLETNLHLIYDHANQVFKVIGVSRDISALMTARQELIDLQQYLTEAQNIAKIGYWQFNLNTEDLVWPSGMSQLYENDPHDAPRKGDEFFRFVHPEDQEYVRRCYRELFQLTETKDNADHEIRFRIITPKGNVKFIKSRFKFGLSPRVIQGINVDITAEVENEARLAQSETNYRQLVESFPFGIGIAKSHERVFVNKKLAELFELSPEEFVRYPLDAFAVEETRALLANRVREIKAGKAVPDIFLGKFITSKSKVEKTFEIYSSEILWEGERARLALLIDITELRENQQKIVQSENMLRLAQEFAGMRSWQLSLTDDTGRVNDQKLSSFMQRVHEDDRERAFAAFRKCVNGEIPYEVEFRVKMEDGEIQWVAEKGNVIRNSSGVPVEMFGVTRDITKEKTREQELLEAKFHAEESYRNQERFFSVMSHEIRTPLNAILGLTDLLLRKSGKRREIIRALKSSSDNLMHVVDGILDLTKSKVSDDAGDDTDFNVHELLINLESTYLFLSREKGIDFVLNISADVPQVVCGNLVKIFQVLNNLLDNAVKFTSKGYVRLDAQLAHQHKGKYVLQFIIEDTGIGIAKQKVNEIFEPFHQLTFSTKKRGTGLGLAIVKNLVSHLQGTLTVNSEPNVGTSFVVSIPFSPAQEKRKIADKVRFNELKKKKILYVEDVETNQFLIENLLEMYGARCDVAADGETALALLTKKRYDLLLLDIQLPGMSGYELLERLKTAEKNSDIPAIVFTADVTKGTRAKILGHRVKEIIYKPYISESLLHTLSGVIERSDHVNMDYYEKIFKSNKVKLAKAKQLVVSDLTGLRDGLEQYLNDQNLSALRKIAHKVKVTLKNINARLLLSHVNKLLSRQEQRGSTVKLCKKMIQEIDSVIRYLNVDAVSTES